MDAREGRSVWTRARLREAAAGGPSTQDLIDLLERLVRRECRSLMPADRDRIRGRIELRLWADSGRRLLGVQDPDGLSRYLLVLVRHERALYQGKVGIILLKDPLVLALRASREGEAADEAKAESTGLLSEWIESALLACTKLQARVVRASLVHETWAKVAAVVGCTKEAARQVYRRALERIREAVKSGRVPPPSLDVTAAEAGSSHDGCVSLDAVPPELPGRERRSRWSADSGIARPGDR